MRTPYILTATVVVASLSGCVLEPRTLQVPADSWVDEQIAQSATAISLAQRQVHQTSAAPTVATAVKKDVASSSLSAAVSVPAGAQAVSPASTATVQPAAPLVAAAKPQADRAPPIGSAAAVTPATSKVVEHPTVAPVKDFSSTPAPAPATVVASNVQAPKPALSKPDAKASPPKPVAKPPPPPPPPPKPVWEARVGDSLRQVISLWSQRANYKLDWQAEDLDYPIEAPLRFEGTFEEAVASIFQLYEKAARSFVVDGRRAQHRLNVSEDHDKSKRTSR